MDLYAKITGDIKTALKGGDTVRLSVLRMALSDIMKTEIDKKIDLLDSDSVIQIILKHARQHRESIEQFDKAGRTDLADKEKLELSIIEEYLPKQLSEDELTELVKAAIAAIGAVSKSDTGKIMKAVMEKAKGRADGKAINRIVGLFLK